MKYYTYEQLKKFNASSIRTKKNRNFHWKHVNSAIKIVAKDLMAQKEDLKFPLLFAMIHNDREMRTEFALGSERVWLDISFKQYAQLNNDDSFEDTQVLI